MGYPRKQRVVRSGLRKLTNTPLYVAFSIRPGNSIKLKLSGNLLACSISPKLPKKVRNYSSSEYKIEFVGQLAFVSVQG